MKSLVENICHATDSVQRTAGNIQRATDNLQRGIPSLRSICGNGQFDALRSGRPSRAIAAAGSLFCFEPTSPLIDKSSRHSVKTV
jgi:hypothetical protein